MPKQINCIESVYVRTPLVHLGWNSDGALVAVTPEGNFRISYLQAKLLGFFTRPQSVEEARSIFDCSKEILMELVTVGLLCKPTEREALEIRNRELYNTKLYVQELCANQDYRWIKKIYEVARSDWYLPGLLPRPDSWIVASPALKNRSTDELLKDYNSVLQQTGKLVSFMSDSELLTLYLLSQASPSGTTIVEIGSAYGKTSVVLAYGAKLSFGQKVYAIDPWIERDPFIETVGGRKGNIEEVKNVTWNHQIVHQNAHNIRVMRDWDFVPPPNNLATFERSIRFSPPGSIVPIRASSSEAVSKWNLPIGLLLVDGDHSYKSCKADIEAWWPHIVKGGIIAVHDACDIFWIGVGRAVAETLLQWDDVEGLCLIDSLVFAVKGPGKTTVPQQFFEASRSGRA